MTPRILVAGYYGSGNAGDEAILTVLLGDLRARRPGLEFTIVSNDPAATAARHHARSLGPTDVAGLVAAAEASDLIVLGGGGVFHDYWGCAPGSVLTRDHAGIPFYAGFPVLAALTARPSMIYAAGVGPLSTDEGRRLTRVAFEQASVATVRDVESRETLRVLGVPDVPVTADPAFNLAPDPARAADVLARLGPLPRAPLVAVCLRTWQHEEGDAAWEAELARALDEVIERMGACVLFVPFQVDTRYFMTDDVAAAARVTDRMIHRARTLSLTEGHDPETLAGIVARCELVVGMRLHALVFAAAAGVPALGLAYDAKVTNLMTGLGLAQYALGLDAVETLAERTALAWDRRDAIRADLVLGGARLRQAAAENADRAVALLDGPPASPAPSTEWLRAFALQQTRRLAEREELAESLTARLQADAEKFSAVSTHADALAAQVAAFTGSQAWQVSEGVRAARRRLAPTGSRRDRTVRTAVTWAVTVAEHGVRASLGMAARGAWPTLRRWVGKPRGVWALDYRQESHAGVTLYTDRDDLFPHYRPRAALSAPRRRSVTVSLITTVRNEGSSVPGWMASVAAQTRRPDEIVVVDAGSTDGTPRAFEAEAARLGLTVRVVVEPGANISRGRNVAIERAQGEVLAVTDLGGRLTPTWLEHIVAPFEDDEGIQVTAGWYLAMERGRARRRRRWPTLDEADPASFLPSSRSFAFTRAAWATAGGYPEWLTLTGEDTWFAMELHRFCPRWAFVPEAVVLWDAPARMLDYWRKIHLWSVGDGESGFGAPLYWRSARRLLVVLAAAGMVAVAAAGASWLSPSLGIAVLAGAGVAGALAVARRRASLGSVPAIAWEVGAEGARALGFLRGAARRREVVARRHRGARGMVFILSGVPIDDTGGGARCTQLALELLKQGWFVVFISRFPRYESTNLGLRISHPRLHTAVLEGFAGRQFIRDHARVFRDRPVAAIVEFPLAEFLPLARAIGEGGGAVVYDLLDNWDSTLGREWYSAWMERKFIGLSDVLVATAAPLADRLTAMSGRPVTLLPNAVNTDLFDPGRAWPRPADFPRAAWSMIYVGALWGDWFDWYLLSRLALVYPEAAVVMVGDYREQMTGAPANVHFLGLKAQVELPAYLAHADVAIVPWKINPVTHATSPLKVYEYLAMRRPVVAPGLDALAGIPGVLLSADTDDFIRNVGRARGLPVDRAVVDAFVRDNSWSARIRTLLDLIAAAKPRQGSAFDAGRRAPESDVGFGPATIEVQAR